MRKSPLFGSRMKRDLAECEVGVERNTARVFQLERLDTREDYGEERINLVGMCDGVLLHVTYTERGERIRVISARRTERHEQDDYYRENSR